MARTLDDLYKFYRYIVRKQKGVYITPEEFADNLDNGQMDAVAYWFKGYGINQEVHDALLPLKKYYPFTSDTAGFVAYQPDHLHLIGSPFSVFGSAVTNPNAVNEDELPFALTSQLRPVELSNPIYIETNKGVPAAKGLQFWPQSQIVGAYTYLRRPAKIVYAYTQVGRVITFDLGNSQGLEFLEIYWNNIIARALAYAGVNMDEAGIYQFSEQYQKETE